MLTTVPFMCMAGLVSVWGPWAPPGAVHTARCRLQLHYIAYNMDSETNQPFHTIILGYFASILPMFSVRNITCFGSKSSLADMDLFAYQGRWIKKEGKKENSWHLSLMHHLRLWYDRTIVKQEESRVFIQEAYSS